MIPVQARERCVPGGVRRWPNYSQSYTVLQYLDGLGQVLHDYWIRALDSARLRYYLSRDLSYLFGRVCTVHAKSKPSVFLNYSLSCSQALIIDRPANHAHLFRRLARCSTSGCLANVNTINQPSTRRISPELCLSRALYCCFS